ncbi:MAG: TonB-dependent receptor [Flavobacteriales bacterium]|nr:TonB-dependent receptor [Flavobacteriales bacterium]
MRSLRSSCIAVLALWVPQAVAQTITVVDAVTRAPLEAATLHHPTGGVSAITDAKGRTAFAPFASADSIHFRMIGYRPQVLAPAQVIAAAYRVALERQPFALEEFVVSAHRWEQDATRVPRQVSVMRPRDVAFNNPGTAADLLESSGEVFMQRSQLGGGSPMLRGFAANRVLIVVDGVRMNNAIYRGGNLQNVIGVDASALERAEVLHGPGAMTYGSDAIGGVMDFHLLRPRFSQDTTKLARGGAMMRYGSAAHERSAHLHYGLGGRRIAFVASGSLSGFGDLRTGSHGPDDYLRPWYVERVDGRDSMVVNSDPRVQVGSAYTNAMAMAKLAWRPASAWEIGLNGYYSTTSDIPRYDRLIELRPNGLPRSAEWYYGPQTWMMAALDVRHKAGGAAYDEARLRIAWQDHTESRHDRNFGIDRLRVQQENVQGLWTNLDAEKSFGTRTVLLYGAETVHNMVGSTGFYDGIVTGAELPVNSRYPDGSTWYTASAYAGVLHDLTEALNLSAGLRYNIAGLDLTFDTTLFPYPVRSATLGTGALTGNLGAAYRPGEGWKLSADLSTGFRAPNIDDMGKVFDSAPGMVVVPDPDLRPEYAYSGEVAVERTFASRARVRVGGYAVLLEDAMVRRPFTLDGADSILFDGEPSRVEAIVNAARAKVFGVFIGADVRIARDWLFTLRYNWQDGVEQDDAGPDDVPLRHAPPSFGRVGLDRERGRWRVQGLLRFSGGFTFDDLPPTEQAKFPIYARDEQGRPHAPAWYAVDLRGRYLITRGFEITAGVENITDQRYRPYSSGISAPGRNVVVALRYAF